MIIDLRIKRAGEGVLSGLDSHGPGVDHNNGQFFRAMEWLMFFFWATIAVNGFSMVLTKLDHHH